VPRIDGPAGTEPQWKAFAATTAARHGAPAGDYSALWQWSVDELDAFWLSIWEHFDVQADGTPSVALAERAMPGATWFPGVALNYAEHVFRGVEDDDLALIEAGELRATREVTWRELRELTARIAGWALEAVAGDDG